MKSKILEWGGVISAIFYTIFIALNIGMEIIGFILLLISALLLGYWSYLNKFKGIIFLQCFYAIAAILGIYRWGFDS
ncbi:MAG: hypothetical protein CFH19_00733 [Alphaproteobacteria bacterium MarineAlpha5_Bin9]|nr:MAG: hypothetical protein CFH19_00733 [Alphaproteobacteria bacterium MarineAlpha5_Bin9]|tara:strand:- start:3496 stop:3726 length:231 start_codon:yes stop_codon:yes gene_type:complete